MKTKKIIDTSRVIIYNPTDKERLEDWQHLNSDIDWVYIEIQHMAEILGLDRKTICQYARRNKLMNIAKYVYRDGLHDDEELDETNWEGVELVLVPIKEMFDYLQKKFRSIERELAKEHEVAEKYRDYLARNAI